MRVDAIGFAPISTAGPRAVVQGPAWDAAVQAQRFLQQPETTQKNRLGQPLRKTAMDAISDVAAEVLVRPKDDPERDLTDQRKRG